MNTSLSRLGRELASALTGLTSAQTQLRLSGDPSRWSIQQIVQHLLLTYSSTATSFESRLVKATPTLSQPTLNQRAARFIVITLGLMPGRRKSPSEVAPAWPETPLSGDQLSVTASESLGRLDLLLDRANRTFDSHPCQSHFALGPLSASQWDRFHLIHGRHHIRQIAAIRRTHSI